MRRDQLWIGTVGIATLALVTLGCENTAKGVKQDTEKNTEAAKPYVDAAAEKAKAKLKEAAENAKPAAEKAGDPGPPPGDAPATAVTCSEPRHGVTVNCSAGSPL